MKLFNTKFSTESLYELMLSYLRASIQDRIEREFEPMRKQMEDMARKIYEEETAKFSVNMFELVHIDRFEKELRITIRKEEKGEGN